MESRNTGVIGMYNDCGQFFSVPTLPYAYMHWDCCGPAFMADRLPVDGEPFLAEGFYDLKGNPLIAGNSVVCGTCGKPVWEGGNGPKASDFRTVNGGTS